MFRTQFDQHEHVYQNIGNRFKIVYSPTFDSRGVMTLEESGRDDLYSFIQSHAASCDIHVILDRYVNGDVNVLSKVQGVYADLTQFPKTYADVLNQVIAGEKAFNALDVDTKIKFNNSFSEFMASIGSDKFNEIFGLKQDPAPIPDATVQPVDKEVSAS